jgi:hypothetical protein
MIPVSANGTHGHGMAVSVHAMLVKIVDKVPHNDGKSIGLEVVAPKVCRATGVFHGHKTP